VAESAEEAAETFVSDDGGYKRERWSQAAESVAVASGRGGAGSDRQQGCFGGSWLVVGVSRSAAASAGSTARHNHLCPVATTTSAQSPPLSSRHLTPIDPSPQSPPRGGGASCGGGSKRRDHHCRLLLYRLRPPPLLTLTSTNAASHITHRLSGIADAARI
jgi:hypothetical protein